MKRTWNVPNKSRALSTTDGSAPTCMCWNCGMKCGAPRVQDCTVKPIDEAVIAKNKKAFYKNRGRGSGEPLRKTGTKGKFKGKPLIRNKNGIYVLDSAKVRQTKKAQELKDRESALATKESQFKEKKEALVKKIEDASKTQGVDSSLGFPTHPPQTPNASVSFDLGRMREALLNNK